MVTPKERVMAKMLAVLIVLACSGCGYAAPDDWSENIAQGTGARR